MEEEAAALPPGTRFVRLLWTDLAGLRRARVIPASAWEGGRRPAVALAEVCLSLQTLVDAAGAVLPTPPGRALLVPGVGARVVPLAAHPGHAMVACDVKAPGGPGHDGDGQPHVICPRTALARVVTAMGQALPRYEDEEHAHGLSALVGFEVEFRLLARGGATRAAAPAATGPATYALAATLDAAAPILDAIADGLAAAGIAVQQYHGESGTGAFEVVTGPSDPVTAVDNLVYTRQIISTVAAGAGYDVTFAPKPVAGEAGLGAHAHISVWQQSSAGDAHPICVTNPAEPIGSDGEGPDSDSSEPWSDSDEGGPGPEADGGPYPAHDGGPEHAAGRAFMAGILRRLDGLVALTAGSPASFERAQPGAWAGAHQRWAVEDKEAPLRFVPATPGRFEVKCLDATANPYVALAALLTAGVAGVRDRAALDPPAAPLSAAEEAAFRRRRGYPWVCPPAGARLPQSAEAALDALRRGDVRIVLSDCFPAALRKLIVAARQADAAAAAQIAAGPGGLEALRAAYNRVYS